MLLEDKMIRFINIDNLKKVAKLNSMILQRNQFNYWEKN